MSWLKADVAKAQRKLVEQELNGEWPETYKVFVRAMEFIEPAKIKTLLDAGCGCGHYAVICQRQWGHIRYTGTDFSEHMIKQAKMLAPLAFFERCEFLENNFGGFDVCLVSGTIEYTENPLESLSFLLENARNYIILHRLHLTMDESHQVLEPTYCGNHERKMHWNEKELREIIASYNYEILYRGTWDEQLTLVLG